MLLHFQDIWNTFNFVHSVLWATLYTVFRESATGVNASHIHSLTDTHIRTSVARMHSGKHKYTIQYIQTVKSTTPLPLRLNSQISFLTFLTIKKQPKKTTRKIYPDILLNIFTKCPLYYNNIITVLAIARYFLKLDLIVSKTYREWPSCYLVFILFHNGGHQELKQYTRKIT